MAFSTCPDVVFIRQRHVFQKLGYIAAWKFEVGPRLVWV